MIEIIVLFHLLFANVSILLTSFDAPKLFSPVILMTPSAPMISWTLAWRQEVDVIGSCDFL